MASGLRGAFTGPPPETPYAGREILQLAGACRGPVRIPTELLWCDRIRSGCGRGVARLCHDLRGVPLSGAKGADQLLEPGWVRRGRLWVWVGFDDNRDLNLEGP